MSQQPTERQDQEKDPTVGKDAVNETMERYEAGQESDSQRERELGKVEQALEDNLLSIEDRS